MATTTRTPEQACRDGFEAMMMGNTYLENPNVGYRILAKHLEAAALELVDLASARKAQLSAEIARMEDDLWKQPNT